MTGQGNILENNLATLTREINFMTNLAGKHPVWSLSRHQIEDVLSELKKERDNILRIKKAGR